MLIAFGHKIAVGKDTAAEILVQKRGFTRISFADRLKEYTSMLFGIPTEWMYDRTLKETKIAEYNKSPREILVEFGHNMRSIHEDFWVNALLNNIDVNAKNYVLTDLRYPNEAKRVKELGGLCIRIDRNVPKFNYPSEIALDDYDEWDAVIDNNEGTDILEHTVLGLYDWRP